MDDPSLRTPQRCPSCGGNNVLFVAKRNKWSCQNSDCAELFIGPQTQDETESETFIQQRIFLSYAHKKDDNDDHSADLADAIYWVLKDAGHEPWIDVDQLHPGMNWRAEITKGILNSDRVVSVLSPRSIRDPGVCLNEIGIAMSHKHGAIATLLTDKRIADQELIPASISHIQYLDLTDWRAIHAKGGAAWKEWICAKGGILLGIIQKNSGFSGDIEQLSRQLMPFSSSAKIGVLIQQGLIGRNWVIDAIEKWRLTRLDQRMFWLVAGPGMGKSAIAAHLVHYAKLRAVAHHFCEYSNAESRSAVRFVHNLAFMLAARLQDYRVLLKTQLLNLEKGVREYEASELMQRLIIEPLRSQIDGGQRDDRLLVVVDALDEALPELTRLLAEYIPQLPEWIGFVVTSRPDVKAELSEFPAFELTIDNANNLQDMQEFLQDWSQSLPDGELSSAIQKHLFQSSDGNIQYLVTARQGYQNGTFDLKDLTSMPLGLESVYLTWMRRQFGDTPQQSEEWTKLAYPLFELLCVTPRPLPIPVLEKIAGWKGQDRAIVLNKQGSLLVQEDDCLRLCHRSLADWLTSTKNTTLFGVNARDGAMVLAKGLYDRLTLTLNQAKVDFLHQSLPEVLVKLDAEQRFVYLDGRFSSVMESLETLAVKLSTQSDVKVSQIAITLREWMINAYLQVLEQSSSEATIGESDHQPRPHVVMDLERSQIESANVELASIVHGFAKSYSDSIASRVELSAALRENKVQQDVLTAKINELLSHMGEMPLDNPTEFAPADIKEESPLDVLGGLFDLKHEQLALMIRIQDDIKTKGHTDRERANRLIKLSNELKGSKEIARKFITDFEPGAYNFDKEYGVGYLGAINWLPLAYSYYLLEQWNRAIATFLDVLERLSNAPGKEFLNYQIKGEIDCAAAMRSIGRYDDACERLLNAIALMDANGREWRDHIPTLLDNTFDIATEAELSTSQLSILRRLATYRAKYFLSGNDVLATINLLKIITHHPLQAESEYDAEIQELLLKACRVGLGKYMEAKMFDETRQWATYCLPIYEKVFGMQGDRTQALRQIVETS
jgi:hypothetical protein